MQLISSSTTQLFSPCSIHTCFCKQRLMALMWNEAINYQLLETEPSSL